MIIRDQPGGDHPTPATSTAEERRLADALQHEADRITPSPEGWAAITARLDGPDELLLRRDRRRHRVQGAVAAVVALGMVAAATVFALGGGLHRDTAQDPARTPTPPATAGADFRPSTPRTTWTIYRAGRDELVADEVRASAPYDPAQALEALFDQAPTTSQPLGIEANGRNRLSSIRRTDDAILLDLSAADTSTRPTSGDAGKAARLWVQAWVHTAQAAYGTDLPVLITVDGRSTELFGLVDTSRPIRAAEVAETTEQRIFLPEGGERVTSPVALAVNPGPGSYDYVVRDERTGKEVFSQSVDRSGATAASVTLTADLPAGAYELVVRQDPDERAKGSVTNLFESNFVVTGSPPAPTRTPITNPPVTPVALTSLSWPRRDAYLVQEWVPRTTLEGAVAGLASAPVQAEGALVPWRGAEIGSVTADADEVRVDFTRLDNPTAPDATTARRWAATLVSVVTGYLDRDLPVLVTVAGRPVRLFGQLDSSVPLDASGELFFKPQRELFSPREGHWGTGEAVITGRGDVGNTGMTWYVRDAISQETLYQGVTALGDHQTYGFRLPLPRGEYLLEIDLTGDNGATTVNDLTVL